MKVVKVPLRLNFFSGSTDIPAFYRKYSGAALNATINQYIYVLIQQTADNRIHFSFSESSEIAEDVDKMEHILTKRVLEYFKIDKGITINSVSSIRCRGTGLGASSAYVVGLIYGISSCYNKHELAELASDIEINKCGYHIGKQDQYAASFGGMNLFHFLPDETVPREEIVIPPRLNDCLFLIDTGIERKASDILKIFNDIIKSDPIKIEHVIKNRDIVYTAAKLLRQQKYNDFGRLLDVTWQMKREINTSATNSAIDTIYQYFKKAGALGGKLLGAGGGGYMLFYVDIYNRDAINRFWAALRESKMKHIPFQFVNEGVKVVYNDK